MTFREPEPPGLMPEVMRHMLELVKSESFTKKQLIERMEKDQWPDAEGAYNTLKQDGLIALNSSRRVVVRGT